MGALSKGETGKLMLLLALAQTPDLLVLDEPRDGLDPVVRRDVLEALLTYVSDQEAAVLISSHLVHELERICDWIGVMDRGRLVAELPIGEFKNGIKHLHVSEAPAELGGLPFAVLRRGQANGAMEQWLVRGWAPEMRGHVEAMGATVVISDVIYDLGPATFQKFWQSSAPPQTAFAAVSSQPLGSWLHARAIRTYGQDILGPFIAMRGIVAGVLVLLLTIAVAILFARERRVA